MKNEECRLWQAVSHSDEEISPGGRHELLTCSSLLPVSFCRPTIALRVRETELSQGSCQSLWSFHLLCYFVWLTVFYFALFFFFFFYPNDWNTSLKDRSVGMQGILYNSACLYLSSLALIHATAGLFSVNTNTQIKSHISLINVQIYAYVLFTPCRYSILHNFLLQKYKYFPVAKKIKF